MLGETGFWVGIAAGLFIGGTLGALAMAMGSVAKRTDEEFDLIDRQRVFRSIVYGNRPV